MSQFNISVKSKGDHEDTYSEFSIKSEFIKDNVTANDGTEAPSGKSYTIFPFTNIHQYKNEFPSSYNLEEVHSHIPTINQQNHERPKNKGHQIKSNKELKVILKNGHRLQKENEKLFIPRFIYYENFKITDTKSWNKEKVVEKISQQNNWSKQISEICYGLLLDAIKYSDDQYFSNYQKLALLEIFYQMFKIIVNNIFVEKFQFYNYFKEFILLYAVENVPYSIRFFMPIQFLGIAQKVSEYFDYNFDLIKAIINPNFEIFIDITRIERNE